MDVSEFIYQVDALISRLRDRENSFLGKEYDLNPRTSNIVEQLIYQEGSKDTDGQMYSTKLLAKPTPNTSARMTVPLLDKLVHLRDEGPGERTSHMDVQWWFVVDEGELKSPSYSDDDDDDEEEGAYVEKSGQEEDGDGYDDEDEKKDEEEDEEEEVGKEGVEQKRARKRKRMLTDVD